MKKLRICLYSFLFLAIMVLAVFYFAPFGRATYRHDFSRQFFLGKGFFHKFGPNERFVNNKIMGDPVYFYLNSPRNFSQAKLKIKYRISPQALEDNKFINIETGVLIDKENWQYNLNPVFNNVLLDLSDSQNIQMENNLFFYQKNNDFKNYQEFLENNNFLSSAFYNYSFDYEYSLSNYQPSDDNEDLIIKNIRGSHSFYVYLKDKNLKIDFSFLSKPRDRQNSLPKNMSIFVYYQDEVIFSENNFFIDNDLEYSLNLPALPEGAYKIEVKTDDDVLIKSIKTPLSKLVFINKVWLDEQDAKFVLFSNKNNFRIKALESLCLGEIRINEDIFLIDKIFQQFNINADKGDHNLDKLTKIDSGSCGFLFENNGLFSFSEESFFDPTLSKLDEFTDIETIDFLLGNFKLPKKIGDYYVSEVDINLAGAIREKDGYNFIISAPFLKNIIDSQYIEIKEIEIELIGKNLFTKIREKINEKF